MQRKAEKAAKKQRKKEKKAAKKAKKKAKKAKKAAKKAAKSSSSSSSSSSSDGSEAGCDRRPEAARRRSSPVRASPERPSGKTRQSPPCERRRAGDGAELGPGGHMVSKREEYAATLAARKEAAIASRGAPRRMDEDEKRRRLEQMQHDAVSHERYKDHRIASAEQREREQEEREARMRMNSDQKYFREIRQEAYMDSGGTMADRLKNQRHRRQKNLNDPLERDE